MTQKHCNSCGATLNPGAGFCPSCGAPVTAQPEAATEKTGRRNKLIIIIAITCAVIAVASVAASLLLDKRDTSNPEDTQVSAEAEPVAEAATIHLEQIEGTVLLTNSKGINLSVLSGMQLFNGNAVGTKTESYAYLSLDRLRAAKLDVNSSAEIKQEGGDMELYLREGNLFFNIKRPLDESETLSIRTSTMVVGIRGTSGVVRAGNGESLPGAYVLDGTVTLTVNSEEYTVKAGEIAELDDDKITVTMLTEAEIDDFAADEIRKDEALQKSIRDETDLDVELIISRESPPSGSEPGEETGSPEDQPAITPEVRSAYLNFMEEVQAESTETTRAFIEGGLSTFSAKYPMNVTGFQLADLNFDGTPEIIMYYEILAGAGGSDASIYTLSGDSFEAIIANIPGNLGEAVQLLQKTSDGTQAYYFTESRDIHGDPYVVFHSFLTDATTVLSAGLDAAAIHTIEMTVDEALNDTYRVDGGAAVDYRGFNAIIDIPPSGYEIAMQTPATLRINVFGTPLPADDFAAFYDSYVAAMG